MVGWNGPRPKPTPDEWAETITKIAIEKDCIGDNPTPWGLWGRNYETGQITELVWYFPTFAEAIAAAPRFWALPNYYEE